MNKKERTNFEKFVELETGRDMSYHTRYRTPGIEFAWLAWQSRTADTIKIEDLKKMKLPEIFELISK